MKWTNGIDKFPCPTRCPGIITCFSLVPAGSHRGKAILEDLIAAKQAGEPIDDVVWDPGYSLCKPGTVHHKLAQAGIHQTFQPVTHQRGIRAFSGEGLLIDGQLFSHSCPTSSATSRRRQGCQRGREARLGRSSTSAPGGG